jgi:hypothetical protein
MSESSLVRVAVHGVPRSGTSWIGEIINSSPHVIYRYQPLFSYALKDYLTPSSAEEDIDEFFRALEGVQDPFIDQAAKRASGRFPAFAKDNPTHLVYKEVRYVNILWNLMRRTEDVYLCAVIRNPLSVVNSWLRAPREFRRDLGWVESEEWRYALKKNMNKPEEFNGFEKWKEATYTFLRLRDRFPDRTFILHYDDFVSNPLIGLNDLFSFLRLPITSSTLEFIRESRTSGNSDAYAVFRDQDTRGKWKYELDPAIISAITDDLRGTELEKYVGN